MGLIIEVTMTVLMAFGGGSDYVPDPRQEVMAVEQLTTAPHKAAARVAAPTEAATPPNNSQPVDGVWERLAVCESGMGGVPRWDYNGSSGFDGGIQFHPRTWNAFRDDSDPSYAYQASPARQIEIGKRVAAAQGAGAWPSCTAKLGITTEELLQ